MALESINKAITIKLEDEAALILKGNVLIGLNRFDEAVTIFNNVISRNNKNKAAWKGKGYAFIRLGRYREAVKCYDEALKIDDMDAESLHYKGLALSQLGEEEEASQYQERAVIIEPSYAYEPGSIGFKNVNIETTQEQAIGGWISYLPLIDIECDWYNMSAESAVPGGLLKSKNLVVPGGIIRFSLFYSNKGNNETEIDPLNRDWARDVVVSINYSTDLSKKSHGSPATLVSASISPDYGTDNQWTIKNLRSGSEGRIDIAVRVPDELRNKYFIPFIDYNITWMDVESLDSNTPSILYGKQGAVSYHTVLNDPSEPNEFDVPPEAIFLSMGFPQFSLAKSASSSTIVPGESITYTINYNNLGGIGEDLVYRGPGILPYPPPPDLSWTRNITIIESYPHGATFISADPAPDRGTNNQWTIKDVAKGAGGTIKVTVKVPEAPAIVKFASQESVNGAGFIRSTRDITTEIQPYIFRNSINLMYGTIKLQSATNSVTVSGDPGTELLQSESGSGTYSSEAIVNYNRETNFIREADNLSARHSPTVFNLPKGRSITYNSKWDKKILARNYMESELIQDSYQYANYLDRKGTIELSNNSTRMELEADFDGLRHLEYRKVSNSSDKGHRSTIQDISQDYAGSFKVSELIESKFTNRTNAISDVKKYSEPHITIYQLGEPDKADPMNINYIISILNDGNRTLGPIYVRDIFPAGTSLLSSSISTTSGDSEYGEWVFTNLPIDGSITIYLQVGIDSIIDPSTNRVYVTASYDGTSVSATDSTATYANWLSCSPGQCPGYLFDV